MDRGSFETESRVRYAHIFRIVDSLVEHVEAYLPTLGIKGGDGLNIVKVSLLLRLATGLDAARTLASRGFHTEATSQVRGLMEAMVRLTALCKQPSLLDDYIMQDELNRAKILVDILSFRKSWDANVPRNPSDEEIAAMLDQVKQTIRGYDERSGKTLREIKVFDWAKIGGVEDLIFGQYPIMSQAVHHAPRDLERRFVIEQGDLASIIIGPEPGNVPYLLFVACKFVFVGFHRFVESAGLKMPDAVEVLYHEYNDAFGRLADEGLKEGGL